MSSGPAAENPSRQLAVGHPLPNATESCRSGSAPRAPLKRQLVTTVALVYGSFLLFSAVRMPVPAPNEPHYLAKARHYWDPSFCPGDFFLDSADAHLVFYQTVGLMTRVLTFEQTAVAGRLIANLLLAVGWTLFVGRLLPGRWSPLWAAWAFLALAAVGNFSGEWMVGGVEAKIFSYAFVFLALWGLAGRRWKLSGALFGLAVAFHPVVGVWSLACALFAGLLLCVRDGTVSPLRGAVSLTAAAGLFIICALPGLWPVFGLLGGPSPAVRYQADYIQVFYRLKHHLDPMQFSLLQYAGYASLLLLWLWLRAGSCRAGPLRGWGRSEGGAPGAHGWGLTSLDPSHPTATGWFDWFVAGSLLIAGIGLLAGLRLGPPEEMTLQTLRTKVLKLYPFRLADIMLPVACAVTAVAWTLRGRRSEVKGRGSDVGDDRQHRQSRIEDRGSRSADDRRPRSSIFPPLSSGASTLNVQRSSNALLCWLVFGAAAAVSLLAPAPNRNPSRMPAGRLADWKDACRWIAEHAPEDAQFLTPAESWAFKWYARRAEYVSRKDCPQDAEGIVEWNRRLLHLRRWSQRHGNEGYPLRAVCDLRRETPITHVIAGSARPWPCEPIYRNGTYRVYDLRVVDTACATIR